MYKCMILEPVAQVYYKCSLKRHNGSTDRFGHDRVELVMEMDDALPITAWCKKQDQLRKNKKF
jgi:hypothetical protein